LLLTDEVLLDGTAVLAAAEEDIRLIIDDADILVSLLEPPVKAFTAARLAVLAFFNAV
jgi:hypothetical protein